MDIIMFRKSLILVCFFLMMMFWATSLIGDVQKILPPALPETQEKCDQTEPKATAPDSSASMNPLNEKAAGSGPLPPPPFQIQESFGTGG